nr:unnamed protein product [Digitaria exilis]
MGPVVGRRFVLTPGHMCGTQGRYEAGSAYEANLRRLAVTIAAEVTASAYCYWRLGVSSPDYGACVALAFREAQRLCPYHRQAVAVIDGGACSVRPSASTTCSEENRSPAKGRSTTARSLQSSTPGHSHEFSFVLSFSATLYFYSLK